jgi:hypothetical protein
LPQVEDIDEPKRSEARQLSGENSNLFYGLFFCRIGPDAFTLRILLKVMALDKKNRYNGENLTYLVFEQKLE